MNFLASLLIIIIPHNSFDSVNDIFISKIYQLHHQFAKMRSSKKLMKRHILVNYKSGYGNVLYIAALQVCFCFPSGIIIQNAFLLSDLIQLLFA